MFPSPVRPSLLCALLVAMAGCTTPIDWREFDARSASLEDLWQETARIAGLDGLPVDQAASDTGQRILLTHWRTRAMPFRGSVRRRLHAEFERPENSPHWRIRFYVERQEVTALGIGFQPKEEDWDAAGQDGELEQRLLVKLQLRFGVAPTVVPPERR